jgi:hypothetical protein
MQLRSLIIPTYTLPCIFHLVGCYLLSAKKSKLQKQEMEEHQWPQQVTRASLFLDRKIEERITFQGR